MTDNYMIILSKFIIRFFNIFYFSPYVPDIQNWLSEKAIFHRETQLLFSTTTHECLLICLAR